MQVVINCRVVHEGDSLPVHYNEMVQGWIYHHLGAGLAEKVHTDGWQDGNRRLRFFTFSRLGGNVRVRDGRILFLGEMRLRIASPLSELLGDLASELIRTGRMSLGNVDFEVISVEVPPPHQFERPVLLKALSPITTYSTLTTGDGRKKTYYYAPQEPDFARLVLENLRRKIRTWTGEDIPSDGASFRPVKVSNRNLVVARYKGTIVKGWTGIYELDAPEPYFRMALDAGLGAKNSQGFGFVEVWEPRKQALHRGTEDTEK